MIDTTQPEGLRDRLRSFEKDHTPDGWPAVRMRDITALLDDLDNARSDNQVLRLGYAAARLEIESLQRRVLDAAFDAVRKKLCALPRYSFVLDDDGLIRRAQDRVGNWIEFDEAHALFDPVSVDAARKQGGA